MLLLGELEPSAPSSPSAAVGAWLSGPSARDQDGVYYGSTSFFSIRVDEEQDYTQWTPRVRWVGFALGN